MRSRLHDGYRMANRTLNYVMGARHFGRSVIRDVARNCILFAIRHAPRIAKGIYRIGITTM